MDLSVLVINRHSQSTPPSQDKKKEREIVEKKKHSEHGALFGVSISSTRPH